MGFSLGGPVVKDKVHFFASGEYIRVRSSDTEISWVPTPEFIAASNPATQQFFSTYGGGATINGPILTRGDVSAIVGTAAGAFNNLPASLPVFGRVEKSLPIDAGGGDPQDQYQFVGRLDFSLSTATQAYVRYAYQNQETEPGTNASSPYDGYDTGLTQNNHNVLGSLTHVFSPTFTSQTKVVLEQGRERPAAERRPGPDALHEPDDGRAPPGLPDRVPRLPALEPGQRDPVRRPAEAARRSTRTSTG